MHFTSLLQTNPPTYNVDLVQHVPAEKHPRITVILDGAEHDRFERYCEEKGFKKSTLIARLIREHLDAESYATQAQLSFPDATRPPQHKR